jgi:MFS family permease
LTGIATTAKDFAFCLATTQFLVPIRNTTMDSKIGDDLRADEKDTSTVLLESDADTESPPQTLPQKLLIGVSIILLFLNYFLAQYDKFVLSYFQASIIADLGLTSQNYGVLSGYATGIVYALLAIPVAFIADYTKARVWTLSIAALWWSICVVFQGLSHNFWQILLARIGMGLGQAPVEALSVSLISDMVDTKWLFLAESVLYVGVYVGEAVSGQIATAFAKTNTSWNVALKAIGIVGVVLAFVLRLVIREPKRRAGVVVYDRPVVTEGDAELLTPNMSTRLKNAKTQLLASVSHIMRMRSLWLLTLSSGARQFSGNVFGYYMPSYLSAIYPTQLNLLSNYGIIVGVVGSVAVVIGGLLSSAARNHRLSVSLYLTGIGGIISAPFVILMVISLDIAQGDQYSGVKILYGVMTAAYLTAELWLGAFASVLALLLPPATKTFGLAIYGSVIVLIYSSAPQIIGLALRFYDPASDAYTQKTKVILAVLIPVGYAVGGVGFLASIRSVNRDIRGDIIAPGGMSTLRKTAFFAFFAFLGALTIALFVVSLVVQ